MCLLKCSCGMQLKHFRDYKMYGRKASELVKELTCTEPGQLSAFDVRSLLFPEFNSLIMLCEWVGGLIS